MKKINKKGFTLIELLVVIAIIGLLSTMAVISLNSARAKSRDAKRVSDVKQMSTVLSLAANEISNAVVECAAGVACTGANKVGDVVGTNPAITDPSLAVEFDKFLDPSQKGAGSVCPLATPDTCDYSFNVSVGNDVTDIGINFYIENATGGLTAGNHWIDSEGIIN